MKPLRQTLSAIAFFIGLLVVAVRIFAGSMEFMRDDHDDYKVFQTVQDNAQVKAQAREIKAVKKWLYDCKDRDFVALFGKPQGKPDRTYALPCAEPRLVLLSGRRYADESLNKDRWDFHPIGDFAGIHVHIGIGGQAPTYISFYLKVDRDFTKLDNARKLRDRLAWDTTGLSKLFRHIESQRRKVFIWEVDPADEKKRSEGVESPDPELKFKAWLKWGEDKGYRLHYRPHESVSMTEWRWFDGKTLVARAAHGGRAGAAFPLYFEKCHADGKLARDEWGWPKNGIIRWTRPDNTLVRYESGGLHAGLWRCSAWMWRNKEGKDVRHEWDDNGDGIPDWYRLGPDEKKQHQRLKLADSWAVYPELIPDDLRVPEQDNRKIVIRKIPEAR